MANLGVFLSLVLQLRGTENKYEAPYQGPYKVIKVNDNGTVCLKIGAVEEMINLRRLTPYIPANAPDHGGECSMPLCRNGKRTRLAPKGTRLRRGTRT